MGVARETVLVSIIIFVFQVKDTNINEVKLKILCYSRD